MIQLFLLIGFAGVADCNKGHAKLGNYTSVIPNYDLCGYGRDWFKRPNHCFKDHPFYSVPIMDGRQALNGEAPWIVYILTTVDYPWYKLFTFDYTLECTGALITDQWVLTAAHCYEPKVDETKHINVWVGTQFKTGKVYTSESALVCPWYSLDDQYDALLIKLNEPVQIEHTGDYYKTNTICLPPNDIKPKGEEFVFLSGWGHGHDNGLQIASFVLDPELYTGQTNKRGTFQMTPYGPYACFGDSGAPVWEYYDGKAVIIGVFGGTFAFPDCKPGINAFGVYIPKIVDWIIWELNQTSV